MTKFAPLFFYKIPKMYECIYTRVSLLHTSNATWEGLFHPSVIVHSHLRMCIIISIVHDACSKNAYDSKNNPFNGGKGLRPISITRQLYSAYPSHHFLIMYFSVTICQYCCRFWPKNGNSKTSWQPVQIVPIFTRMHPILHMLRDCYSTRNSCLYTQGMLCHVH